MDWEEPKRPQVNEVRIGADLSRLSVEELQERLDLLAEERIRIEKEIAAKQATRDAAESVFKS